jgi:hypothetical protein
LRLVFQQSLIDRRQSDNDPSDGAQEGVVDLVEIVEEEVLELLPRELERPSRTYCNQYCSAKHRNQLGEFGWRKEVR